ncbi:MAG TPA: hypothetical protein VER03_03250 [Bryobacteraceae bacterium]|nr:hypothetical protein [Bryobacteraceae bacterium]
MERVIPEGRIDRAWGGMSAVMRVGGVKVAFALRSLCSSGILTWTRRLADRDGASLLGVVVDYGFS